LKRKVEVAAGLLSGLQSKDQIKDNVILLKTRITFGVHFAQACDSQQV